MTATETADAVREAPDVTTNPMLAMTAIPVHRVPFGYECIRFATEMGYAVCFREDTGKAHIAKPMGQQYGKTSGNK